MITVNPISKDTSYIVESGLSVGDRIIAEGVGFIKEGTAVSVNQK